MDHITIDTPALIRITLATLAGTILCLDRIAFQLMLSRPIIVAPVAGLILGAPLTGLWVGALIEVFWINKAPLGTYLPPNDSIVAVVTAITVIILAEHVPLIRQETIVLAILCFLPLGFFSQKLEPLTVRFNEKLSDKALREIDSGAFPIKRLSPTLPLLIYACYTFSLMTLSLVLGLAVIPWIYQHLPPFAQTALFYTYFTLPPIGVAVALTTTHHKKTLT
ncbi:MAG TPA: PTS sugar transporter subunit IIC, partial [Syntrophales bacterium]|nr:PTS sugar transporter subunit IIC [Syntrophales bacterium]